MERIKIEELNSGQTIIYGKSEYTFISKCLFDKRMIYAKHNKNEVVKTIPIKKVKLKKNENQFN